MFSLFQLLSREDLHTLKKEIETTKSLYAHFRRNEACGFQFSHVATHLAHVDANELILSYGNPDLENRISHAAQERAWIVEIDASLQIVQLLSNTIRLEEASLLRLLESRSPLRDRIDDFHSRPGQQEMMRCVIRAMNEGGMHVIEAGTGTGKTFAYLIPAVAFAQMSDECVVVSTATIPLQQQVYEKDLPVVQGLLGSALPLALAKGKTHYLCREKIRMLSEEGDMFSATSSVLQQLIAWSEDTVTGDRSDLSFPVNDEDWQKVSADTDLCTIGKCPHSLQCCLRRAKEKVQEARIVVTNHALLLTDLSIRERSTQDSPMLPLPPFRHLIFDEAHSIYGAIRAIFSEQFSAQGLLRHLTHIEHSMKSVFRGRIFSGEDETVLRAPIAELRKNAAELHILLEGFFPETSESPVLTRGDLYSEQGTALTQQLENISLGLKELRSAMKEVIDRNEESEAVLAKYSTLLQKWEGFIRHFDETSDQENYLGRIEKRGRSYPIIVSPLELSSFVDRYIVEQLHSVVFTSASLAVADNFEYWKRETGLHDANYLCVASPFQYEKQVRVYVPRNISEPRVSEEYQHALHDIIFRSIEASQGGALVLFTSNSAMEACYVALQKKKPAVTLLCQGEEERSVLLRRFQEEAQSVLLGVNSFWVGIDVPGDSLRLLIIARLPFEHPSDPILQARCALLQGRNEIPFNRIQVPEAALRLRQGFGRLIRKKEDHGVVLICDTRIVTKHYGSKLRKVLPQCKIESLDEELIFDRIRLFFDKKNSPERAVF